MTVTADIIHDHIETDLDLYAIERLIDDAYDAIAKRRGNRLGLTYRWDGGGQYLFLDPPADMVTAVTEDDVALIDGEEYDFTLRFDGRALRRNGQEWGETTVQYDATDDEPRTDRVVIDLVHLAIQYAALDQSRSGDYWETHPEYQQERNNLIDELTKTTMGFR